MGSSDFVRSCELQAEALRLVLSLSLWNLTEGQPSHTLCHLLLPGLQVAGIILHTNPVSSQQLWRGVEHCQLFTSPREPFWGLKSEVPAFPFFLLTSLSVPLVCIILFRQSSVLLLKSPSVLAFHFPQSEINK